MIEHSVDVAVVGAGPAGLAAAVSAKENGAKDVLVLDRNSWLGGILPQCIHDGFGIEETGASMTGPEYADMYIKTIRKQGVDVWNETMVLEINKKLEITAVNKKGLHKIKAESIILAMGCREKTRWNIMIPGDRPSGIFTAGVAQAFINLYNIIPGKNVIILGSGDVGLIMARRLKLEGANVLGVVEILPYASGLPRNVVQCLNDYNIPMFLNHTITYIKGRERLESVTIAQVDKNMNVIPETEQEIRCDTLLLSLGLIPENEISKGAGIELDNITGGPVVDQDYMTSLPGVFACGNCLQVYDMVDALAVGAKHAGKYAVNWKPKSDKIETKPGKNVRYVVPQRITKKGTTRFTLRVEKPMQNVTFHVKSGGDEIFKKKLRWVNPANMVEINIDISDKMISSKKDLEVSING
ncbi:MAG: oxidoreductase [Candidatus Asgardarchaeum californiense]|nr:MAG: oxidoreductase [Candidatus Asgardarchaeum californiense]